MQTDGMLMGGSVCIFLLRWCQTEIEKRDWVYLHVMLKERTQLWTEMGTTSVKYCVQKLQVGIFERKPEESQDKPDGATCSH